MPNRTLTEAQVQAAKNAAVAHLLTLGMTVQEFEQGQIEELLRHPTKTMLIYLPDTHPIVKGLFVDNIEPGCVMSLHAKEGRKLPDESAALMQAVTAAVAEVTFDPIEMCFGAFEAYAYLVELEFARRDVGQIMLGYMTMYMFEAQNKEEAPLTPGCREGRRLTWEAFQQVVADEPRELNGSLLADCLFAMMGVLLHLQPPVGVRLQDLIKMLLARASEKGGEA